MPITLEQLAKAVIQGWVQLELKEGVVDQLRGMPSESEIDYLIKMAFYASIQKEEAEYINFSIIFLAKHANPQPRHLLSQYNDFFSFLAPENLSVEKLKKFSGTIDGKKSALLIEKRQDEYYITGIAPFGRTPSILGPLSAAYVRPHALTITVQAPGSMVIARGDRIIGRFNSGEFTPALVTPFHSQALGKDLIELVSRDAAFKEYGASYWHIYAASLVHVLQTASNQSHGGTIVIVPSGEMESARRLTEFGRSFEPTNSVHKTMLEFLSFKNKAELASKEILNAHNEKRAPQYESPINHVVLTTQMEGHNNKLITLLNTVAQLTGIDGAVIMDERYTPVACGARLRAPNWTGEIAVGPSVQVRPSQSISRTNFGTRHNSAIDFVASVEKSIAFVISQDGPVRAITRRGDTVFIWPDCLTSVFQNSA